MNSLQMLRHTSHKQLSSKLQNSKNLEFQLVLWTKSFHILTALGHCLLVSLGTRQVSLKSCLPSQKSTWPRQPDGSFLKPGTVKNQQPRNQFLAKTFSSCYMNLKFWKNYSDHHYKRLSVLLRLQFHLLRDILESQQDGTLRSGLPDSNHSKKSARFKLIYVCSSLKAVSLDKRTTAAAWKNTTDSWIKDWLDLRRSVGVPN